MIFSVAERLTLLATIPKEGSLVTLRILRDLLNNLSFSESEVGSLKFQDNPNGTIQWSPEGDIPKEVEIGPSALKIILEAFKKGDEAGTLSLMHLAIYDRLTEQTLKEKKKK